MIKILIASNAFKECLEASEANNAIERGVLLFKPFLDVPIECKKIEICDGGSGFAKILARNTGGAIIRGEFVDPLMRDRKAIYGVNSFRDTVFIEVAETAGLALLSKAEQNPISTTSFGVGLQIRQAIEKFAPSRILIGCGDTAINDFGIGCLLALGMAFKNSTGDKIFPKTPQELLKIASVDAENSPYIRFMKEKCEVIICCNLSSIIGGKSGTSNIYAKQKGASDDDIKVLNSAGRHFLKITNEYTDSDISLLPGAGGAGGLAGAIHSFCGGQLTYSFEEIFKTINIDKHLAESNFVITGEGKLDVNSLKGKAPIALALFAKKRNIKVGIISGSVTLNSSNVSIRSGLDYVEPLSHESFDLEQFINLAPKLITQATFRMLRKIYL